MKTVLLASVLGIAVVFGPLAFAARAQEATPLESAEGSVRGKVIDSESATPLADVKVTIVFPAGGREEEQTTDAKGEYAFPAIPAGIYILKFEKRGYRLSTMTSYAVKPGEENRADFPLPPLPPEAAEEMPGFEEFVVEASPMEEILAASRMESDEMLNTLSAAEFSKFAASDVADALKFVPGVNVVQGQFAIIRGLEDRYSSTLYNSAVVPSPDPDSQSVQLDLFASDIVTNLVVAKTFAPDLPSNSSGGAINILTNEYPESFDFKFTGGSGWNSNAVDKFYKLNGGSPMGTKTDGWDTVENDFALAVGGRTSFAEREIRYKAVGGTETDFNEAEGKAGGAEPQQSQTRLFPPPPEVISAGDLSFGVLSLTDGTFDLTESEKTEQETLYLALGFDLDTDGRNKIDATYFYTEKKNKTIQLYENGYLDGFDYSALAAKQANNEEIDSNSDFDGVATPTSWIARSVRGDANEPQSLGPIWSANFNESDSFEVTRDLVVYQLNGDHIVDALDGLHFSWVANTARTTQNEESFGARYFYEPDDTSAIPTTFPVTVDSLGKGRFYANNGLTFSTNDIRENQDFARFDLDYEFPLGNAVTLKLNGGYWYERAKRDVGSIFLENSSVSGASNFAISSKTAEGLGRQIPADLDHRNNGLFAGTRESTSRGSREIQAESFGGKAIFWDDFDLLAGARFESLKIESLNDPFTGELAFDGSPGIYPSKYLFFDRLDNPARAEVLVPVPPGTTFNDELLGIDVPINPETGFVDLESKEDIASLVNGDVEERRILPSLGFTYRPLEGLNLRGAYSQTVARPSFREMGFYVSVEPGSDDLIVGNPQLKLSDVTSYDLRTEYTWGEAGDLGALSFFYKTIEKPIESIVIRNPTNFEGASSALYRTFFNNPSDARLFGIEVEGRKNLGFIGPDFAQYFSLGGNFTYIDAKVDRTDAELARSGSFFGVPPGEHAKFESYEPDRRLFGQPEWIANADLTFDNPDWGTRITLNYFAISDILDAAGSAAVGPDGTVKSLTLDRYVDSMSQLNLVASQSWALDILGGDITLKGNVKNLTDSKRRIVYDQEQTNSREAEREYKVGLDYSISLTYSLSY